MSTIRFNSEFPGYEILGEIGLANARVLKARNQRTGELVAIKHFALNTTAETLHRFQREAQIMTQIQHPNVVRVSEVCLEANLPFIVMDFIEGGDLRGLLKERGHLDISTTIRLGLQMAEAFKVIHPEGIVHRDIKPENILYRKLPSGELHFLLTDFGIASARIASETADSHRTKTGQSLLTWEYASPEQFDDPRNIRIASDYYSIGIVLYECIYGKVPFTWDESISINTFIYQVLSIQPKFYDSERDSSNSISQYLSPILRKLLNKKPIDRLCDASTFIFELKKIEFHFLQELHQSESTIDNKENKEPDIAPIDQSNSSPSENVVKNNIKNLTPYFIFFGLIFIVIYLLYYNNSKKTIQHVDKNAISLFDQDRATNNSLNIDTVSSVLLDAPPFKELLSKNDIAIEKIKLTQVKNEKNEIIDDDLWFSKNNLSLPIKDVPNPFRNLPGNCPPGTPLKYKDLILTSYIENNAYNIMTFGRDFGGSNLLLITDKSNNVKHFLDFNKYSISPKYEKNDLEYIHQGIIWSVIEDNILYVSHAHSTYAASSSGMNAYITAINLNDYSIIWRSKPLVANASNFEIINDCIVAGYGFTAEPDHLYVLNKYSGAVLSEIPLATGPSCIIRKEGVLYVRTYNRDYQFAIK